MASRWSRGWVLVMTAWRCITSGRVVFRPPNVLPGPLRRLSRAHMRSGRRRWATGCNEPALCKLLSTGSFVHRVHPMGWSPAPTSGVPPMADTTGEAMLERDQRQRDEVFEHLVLTQHWSWRPEWTPERRCWWWYATFEHDAAVRRLVGQARAALKPGGPVDVVPTRWLHLTLAEVGYAADFPRELAYAAARDARESLADFRAVDLQVGPVATMPGAIVLRVGGAGLQQLHELLVSASPVSFPHKPVQRLFDPHISVAYIGRDCSSNEVLAESYGDELEGVTTRLEHVSLVEVVRQERHYRWTPRCRISLGGQRQRHLNAVD